MQAVNSVGGATAMTALVLSMMIMACIGVLAAGSRMLWAFARDNGVPGARWLCRVEPRSKLPMYSITVSVIITMLRVSSTLAQPQLQRHRVLVVSGYLGSYSVPIFLLLKNRIRRPASVHYGPFKLGGWGIPLNIFSLIWIVVVMVFSFFPSVRTGSNSRDYELVSYFIAVFPYSLLRSSRSCLLWGGTNIIGIIFYFGYLRGRYNGPIVETDLIAQHAEFMED